MAVEHASGVLVSLEVEVVVAKAWRDSVPPDWRESGVVVVRHIPRQRIPWIESQAMVVEPVVQKPEAEMYPCWFWTCLDVSFRPNSVQRGGTSL